MAVENRAPTVLLSSAFLLFLLNSPSIISFLSFAAAAVAVAVTPVIAVVVVSDEVIILLLTPFPAAVVAVAGVVAFDVLGLDIRRLTDGWTEELTEDATDDACREVR